MVPPLFLLLSFSSFNCLSSISLSSWTCTASRMPGQRIKDDRDRRMRPCQKRRKRKWMRNGPKETQPRKNSRRHAFVDMCAVQKKRGNKNPATTPSLVMCDKVDIYSERTSPGSVTHSLFPSFPIFAYAHSQSHSFFSLPAKAISNKKTFPFLTHTTMHRNERTG
ncbi:hypothetical protein F5H01DRAFT_333643 [Linnemannia elongata]|nr:hypothetical protein F5H01DRAFT_333643 [Linnemannia elongata]